MNDIVHVNFGVEEKFDAFLVTADKSAQLFAMLCLCQYFRDVASYPSFAVSSLRPSSAEDSENIEQRGVRSLEGQVTADQR